MIYELTDEFRFGRYKGWTVKDVLFGWTHPTQEFLRDFMKFCFKESYQFDNGKGLKDFVVRDFEFLLNDRIRIHVTFPDHNMKNICFNLNCMLMAGESYPEKLMFNSVNDLILEQPFEEEYPKYRLFSDPSYIEWALNKHDSFWLSEEAISQLKSFQTNSFYGVTLNYADSALLTGLTENELIASEFIFNYKSHFVTYEYSLELERNKYKIKRRNQNNE